MTVYEHDGQIVVVDAGLAFPRDEHLGVDLVLPGLLLPRERRDQRARRSSSRTGTRTTSASLPYLLREIRVRASRDAADARAGQVEARRARPAASSTELQRGRPERRAGRGRPVPARVRPDGALDPRRVAVVLETPAGADRAHGRLQARPHAGRRDEHRRRAGSPSSATAASTCCSATRRTRSGRASRRRSASSARRSARSSRCARAACSSPPSPRTSTACSRRSTSPSSRGRKVAIVGRSMRKNVNIARNLGYVEVPDGDDRSGRSDLEELRPDQQLILCTGSQGEPMSALTRIAYNDHPAVRVERGDTVIISAKPMPGQRAARARRDQPAREARRGGAARGERARARLRARAARRSCARCSRSSGRAR